MSSERVAAPASRADSVDESAPGRTTGTVAGQTTDSGDARSAATAAATTAGRNRITRKALTQVVSAVSASALGVGLKSVTIGLGDDDGALSITVSSPIRLPSLRDVSRDATAVDRAGGTILARAAAAQIQIRERVMELTGSTVSTVTVRLTGPDITTQRRVA